ncbi:ATP-binding protein [Corynebacterium argentoratense]|uniref:ATP-binding protein n=1 Tax=Corynebacterium argentoratense TaxID=42817 RepID=UPI002E1EB31F|nr:AAA family ATPase [Corynebacterium argentoratense]
MINPAIGGVLVRGEKGTAKTTTIRGFADIIDGPLVNLPIGATEDRVVGSLDMETVLTTGRAEYKPGLLAQAHGGILYVDEVNLLADHLVDALLDAAATGQVTVERDGLSHTTPARFVLVGSMNPEEGELRPQLLDRFGLAVDVVASREVPVRAEIMRRRLAFEADPAAFVAQHREEEIALAEQLQAARSTVGDVVLSDAGLEQIASVCAAFDVDGMRADLVIARAATAHAAWRGATQVGEEDIKVAAELALPHRRRRNPFDEPGLDQQQLEDALEEAHNNSPLSEDDQQPEQSDADAELPDTPPQPDQLDEPTDSDGGGKVGRADSGAPFRP